MSEYDDEDSLIKRVEDGGFRVALPAGLRQRIQQLTTELAATIQSGVADQSIYRLFPPGYSNDIGRQLEYDRLMRDDLQAKHIAALETLNRSLDSDVLSEDEMDSWIKALNQLRLVLGTQLEVVQDQRIDPYSLPDDDPRATVFMTYELIGLLQTEVLRALSGEI